MGPMWTPVGSGKRAVLRQGSHVYCVRGGGGRMVIDKQTSKQIGQLEVVLCAAKKES